MSVQISFHAITDISLPLRDRIAELIYQRGESGKAGFHRVVAPHQPPILVSSILAVGRKNEEKITGHPEHLHGDHHLRQILRNQQFLVERVLPDSRHKALLASSPLHAGTVLCKPDRPARNTAAFHMSPDVRQDLRKIPERPVSMDIENIEVAARSIFHHDICIRQHRRYRKTTDRYRRLRLPGFKPQRCGFQSSGVIPRALLTEAVILFVPEFPIGHAAPESLRRIFCKNVCVEKIGREQTFPVPAPAGRVVIHSGEPDPAFLQQFRIGLVIGPHISVPGGIHFGPAHAIAYHARTGTPGDLRNDFKGVSRLSGILRIGPGQPALGGVQSKKHIRICRPLSGIGNYRESATACKAPAANQLQLIVSVGQRCQNQFLPRPRSLAHHFIAPISQCPCAWRRFHALQ